MLARLGIGGAKRLRVAFQGCPAAVKTHTSLVSSADGLESLSKGASHARLCSSITGGLSTTSSSSRAREDDQLRGQYTERAHASTSSSPEPSTSFQHHTTNENELHVRLAGLWGMPCELLFERQQMLAKMLAPAGCGTPVHALWLLVRAPQLRHATEASLRNTLKQLHRLVSHADIDRAAVLTAVYKYPWMVEAMSDLPPAAAAGAGAGSAQRSATAGGTPASFSTTAAVHGAAVAPATWAQELAAVILELQQADYAEYAANGCTGSRGIRMSPAFAAAAVRTYLAVGEAKKSLCRAASSVGDRILAALPGPNYPSTAGDAYSCMTVVPSKERAVTSSSSSRVKARASATPAPTTLSAHSAPEPSHGPHASSSSDGLDPSGVAEVMHQLQQQQQQHLLLQQLLAACPHLTVLPPELLLARYQRLESVVEGSADAAKRLVVANPFLMVSYADQPTAGFGAQQQQGLKPSYA